MGFYADIKQSYAHLDEVYAGIKQFYAHLDEVYADIKQSYAHLGGGYADIKQSYAHLDRFYADIKQSYAGLHKKPRKKTAFFRQSYIALIINSSNGRSRLPLLVLSASSTLDKA